MSTGLYDHVVPSFARALGVLLKLIDKGEAHFHAEGRDPEDLVGLRLVTDMNPFSFQIEAAINNAVGATARLTSRKATRVEGLSTLAELRHALHAALAALDALAPSDFDGAENREIVLPNPKGARHFEARDYILKLALPNVHFHTAMAYALLRVEGLDIGKRDFLGDLPPRRQAA